MKPYYQDDFTTIYHGDCQEIIPYLPMCDLALTSPPYNMRTRIRNGQYTVREWTEGFSKKYQYFHDAYPIDRYYEFHKSTIHALLKKTNIAFLNIQIVTGSKEAWFRLIGDFNQNLKDIIVWDKGQAQPAMHPKVINRGYELLLILESNATAGRAFDKCFFARGEMGDVWRLGRGGNGKHDDHGAVFPVSLASRVITNWCQPGGIILDPFAGTGTTLRAAKGLGYKSIGIEIVERYCEMSANKLRQESLVFV